MNKDCSIVQDLLPLYAEDMLREETKEFGYFTKSKFLPSSNHKLSDRSISFEQPWKP